MSSAPKRTSRARPLPMRRGSRAMGPPPGTRPAPTSHCDKMAFSRLAKRMSLASASSLPTPFARRQRLEHVEGAPSAQLGMAAARDKLLGLDEELDLTNATTAKLDVVSLDSDLVMAAIGMDLPLHGMNVGDSGEIE